MKRILLILPVAFIIIFTFSSCQKVVNINLNASSPKLVIEANLSDQLGSCIVSLSKTVNYNESNTFPPVSGANISITDNSGSTINLIESTTPGLYVAPAFQGMVGHTYILSILSEGKTFTSVCTMAAAVPIDTIVEDSISSVSFGGFGSIKKRIFVDIFFHDPPGIDNYYRFVEIVNNQVSSDIMTSSDELRDGNYILRRIIQRDTSLLSGDSVTVMLETIDKNVFNYFESIDQVLSTGFGGQTATPANPVSNIDNGALGYFSVFAMRQKSIVIH